MTDAGQGVRDALGWAALAVGVFFFLWLGHEWWVFIVRADMARAHLYPFGTEQGWNYSNPSVYGWSALESGIVALTVAVLLRFAVVRWSWRWLGGAALVYGAGMVFELVGGSMHWPVWRG